MIPFGVRCERQVARRHDRTKLHCGERAAFSSRTTTTAPPESRAATTAETWTRSTFPQLLPREISHAGSRSRS
jgi:hypothetical protein